MGTWNDQTRKVEIRHVSGTANLTATVASGVAIADAGDGKVTVTVGEAHGFAAGSFLTVEGTTNYDGTYEVSAVTTSGITFKHTHTTESGVGTETVGFVINPARDFELIEVDLHLSSAAATSENFVVTLDAIAGSSYDEVIITEDVNGHADLAWIYIRRQFVKGDKLRFTLPNSDARTYALKAVYRVL